MATGKIIAGDFSKDEIIKIVAGKPAIVPKDGGLFSKVNFINNDIQNIEIQNIEIITEENKKKFIGTAGWGLVCGLALGPLGLIAGILAGGNKKEFLIACELKNGKKLIAKVDSKIYKSLLSASY